MTAILKKNLRPLLDKGVDTLVLGCTHYPLLRGQIAAICGPGVEVIDTGEPVARQLWRRLAVRGLLNPGPGRRAERVFQQRRDAGGGSGRRRDHGRAVRNGAGRRHLKGPPRKTTAIDFFRHLVYIATMDARMRRRRAS